MRIRACQLLLLCLCQSAMGTDGLNSHLARLTRDLETLRQSRAIPAVIVIIADKDREIYSARLGSADRDTGAALTPESYFRIGSITKTFTALAVLRLVQEGRLSLDDRLMDIAPALDVDNPWRDRHPITIMQLLEHSAGLNDLTRKEFDYNEPLALAGAFALSPDSRVCRWPPGLHHSYSNISAGLLSYVIEKITGRAFEDYVERAVLDPLGMHSATFFPERRVLDKLISGYDTDGHTRIPYWHMTYRAFGALNVVPGDMLPFLQLFLNRGRHDGRVFLKSELMERMQTPATTLAARSGLKYGYGAGLYAYVRDGYVFYGHGGDADGYLSRFGFQPRAGLAYFAGINVFRDQDLERVRRLVERFILEGLPAPDYAYASVPAARISDYGGRYRSVTWRFPNAPAPASEKSLEILLDDDHLTLKDSDGRVRQLIAVNERHFRFAGEPVATLAFVSEGGALYLQGDIGNYQRLE